MAVSEPPGEQPPEDDTALLTTALSHYWAWYEGRYNRAFQIINYYLVATAILFTAYISAINGKHYDVAAALAIAGLGLTAPMAAAVLGEVNAATRAAAGLAELQNRMAGRLRIDPIRMATSHGGRTQRRVAVAVTFGLSALLQISGLLYALIR
jgi:hypothetical protein